MLELIINGEKYKIVYSSEKNYPPHFYVDTLSKIVGIVNIYDKEGIERCLRLAYKFYQR